MTHILLILLPQINNEYLHTKTVTYFMLLGLMMPFFNHMRLNTGQMQQIKVSLSVCNANHDISSLIFSRTLFSFGTTTSIKSSHPYTPHSHTTYT
jgi:hypothetical protein